MESGSIHTMKRSFNPALAGVVLLVAFACGVQTAAAQAPPLTRADAFRFLTQATFGPTQAEIDRLVALGNSSNAYERWIDQQLALEPSLQLPAVQARYATTKNPLLLHETRQDTWFKHAMSSPDQLRQRVAFALSEILVVSQHSVLLKMPFATADYYDLLARSAFGDFRQLIEDVTLHPAMGSVSQHARQPEAGSGAQHPS